MTRLQQAWFTFVVDYRAPRQSQLAIFSCLLMRPTSLRVGKPSLRQCRFATGRSLCFGFSINDEEIQSGKYKSHNHDYSTVLSETYINFLSLLQATPGKQPILVFDRGFSRAKYVIKFLKDREIPFIMRVCRNVGIRYQGSAKKLS